MSLYDDIVLTRNRALSRSYAKINLSLDVLGKLPNGYHEAKMIMQSVNLSDIIVVDKAPFGIHISTNCKFLPNNEKNIAYKATQVFFEHTGIKAGAKILIHKNIPVAAGLAGGSGNAAAVLCSLNLLFDMPLSEQEFFDIAFSLGADVPYCVKGGLCLAEGIGEKLTPIGKIPKFHALLVKPQVSISTASVYKKIDSAENLRHPDTELILSGINAGDYDLMFKNMGNVMQDITSKICPDINNIISRLYEHNAKVAMMSGSGPTVFGLFDDYGNAKTAFDYFSQQYSETFLTKLID